jgi:hypothetical protein
MAPGDWVNTCYSGIWQVYRILPIKHEMRFTLSDHRQKPSRVIVFSRRIVNAKWQRAFKTACCELGLVRPISPDDRNRLDRMLAKANGLRTAFDRYSPKPVPLIVNLSMGIPDRNELEKFCDTTLSPAMTAGLTMEDVLQLLDAADLTRFLQTYPIRATLQMVSRDHEMRDDEFVLRDHRVLPF